MGDSFSMKQKKNIIRYRRRCKKSGLIILPSVPVRSLHKNNPCVFNKNQKYLLFISPAGSLDGHPSVPVSQGRFEFGGYFLLIFLGKTNKPHRWLRSSAA